MLHSKLPGQPLKCAALPALALFCLLACEKQPTLPPPPPPTGTISGQVVENQGGNPVVGAVVKALKNQVSDTTDSSGSFRLEGLSPGLDTLFVVVPGYLILKEVVQIKEGSQPLTLSLTTVLTRVTLQNQTEHSGIMIKIVELDTFAITDSTGHFQFGKLPNGTYTLEAKYPYFSTEALNITVSDSLIQSEVQIQLRQLLQFWIEPAETTISMSNLGNPDWFSFTGMRQYRVNITNEPVTVGTYLDPINPWALVPQGFDWPYIPNPDSIPDLCYLSYGWLGGTDAIIDFMITIPPGDTWKVIVPKPLTVMRKDCFRPGQYLFFSAISDLGHYPEYFDPAFVRGYKEGDKKLLYDKMNRSLFKKGELFRPAIVHIIN